MSTCCTRAGWRVARDYNGRRNDHATDPAHERRAGESWRFGPLRALTSPWRCSSAAIGRCTGPSRTSCGSPRFRSSTTWTDWERFRTSIMGITISRPCRRCCSFHECRPFISVMDGYLRRKRLRGFRESSATSPWTTCAATGSCANTACRRIESRCTSISWTCDVSFLARHSQPVPHARSSSPTRCQGAIGAGSDGCGHRRCAGRAIRPWTDGDRRRFRAPAATELRHPHIARAADGGGRSARAATVESAFCDPPMRPASVRSTVPRRTRGRWRS
jgi:hypothetical protein